MNHLDLRYQITPFNNQNESLDSNWVGTKKEAIDTANGILKCHSDVAYVMCYNMLNQKYNFKITKS